MIIVTIGREVARTIMVIIAERYNGSVESLW